MKKKIAALLVACMMLQLPASALAAGGGRGAWSALFEPPQGESLLLERTLGTGEDGGRTAETRESLAPLAAEKSGQAMEKSRVATDSNQPRVRESEARPLEAQKGAQKEAQQEAEQQDVPRKVSAETGSLKLEFYNFLGAPDTSFTLRLEREGGGDPPVYSKTLDTKDTDWKKAVRGEAAKAAVFELPNLEAGSYLMRLTQKAGGAGAYLPYEQEVEVKEGMISTALLANDEPAFHGYGNDGAAERFGLFLPGNFVSDPEERLDEKDLAALREAMEKGSGSGSRFDLNGDGAVNLVDLEYFCKFYPDGAQRPATIAFTPRITKDMVKASMSNATYAAFGDPQDLFTGEEASGEGVGLKPESGGEDISQDHPVIIGSEFEEPVTIGAFGIVPKMGSVDAMADGEVIFETVDGTEYRAKVQNGEQVGSVQVIRAPAKKQAQLPAVTPGEVRPATGANWAAGASRASGGDIRTATASGWTVMRANAGLRLTSDEIGETEIRAEETLDGTEEIVASEGEALTEVGETLAGVEGTVTATRKTAAGTKKAAARTEGSSSQTYIEDTQSREDSGSDSSDEDEYDGEIELIMDLPLSEIAAEGDAELLAAGVSEEYHLPSGEQAKPVQAHSVLIDLEDQIPVKRVAIRVDRTLASSQAGRTANLVEISRVEFLNDMEDHIPDPELSIPNLVSGAPGDEEFTVTWRRQANVTGYEVFVSGETWDKRVQDQIFHVTEPSLQVVSLKGADLHNNREYAVEVRSVNGDWRSAYSERILVVPQATSRPNPPEQIQIKGGYQKLSLSWKKMKSTDSYHIYYREEGAAGNNYREISGITATKAEITGLKDETSYEIYLTGENALGVSGPSQHYTGKTIILTAPVTPNFRLINVPSKDGGAPAAVESVTYGSDVNNLPCEPYAVVDGKYETAWIRKDWDAGCYYTDNNENKAPTVTFDQAYEMDTIVLIPDYEQTYNYTDAKAFYSEDNSPSWKTAEGRLTAKRDEHGVLYYEFRAKEKFTARQVRLAVRTINQYRISYADLKFYRYHDLEERIDAMYTDSLHMSLKPEVNLELINGFYKELEEEDPASGEKTPRYDALKRELDNAKSLLGQPADGSDILYVDARLAQKRDGHISFRGGLNTWQPLGVAGLAGDTVTIYVGAEGKELGDPTNLTVIAAQYHGESSNVFKSAGDLRVGPNEIEIPKVTNMDKVEAGGPLYINYTGDYDAEKYAVRVLVPEPEAGKTSVARIPVLNLAGVTDESQRTARLEAYVAALQSHDPQALHEKYHGSAIAYDEKNCVFGATDLAGDKAMLSIPAQQALRGLTSSGSDGLAEKLGASMEALDQMMVLFYQHKGLSEAEDAGDKNRMPVSRINIRYQRMFEGAFMYAGGAHIGIEWDETDDMVGGVPIEADENGRYQSGHYFGWGISHEVGHEINEGAYAVAEVTNNYFSVLAQAQDNNDTVRFKYEDVFKKVTSGAKGPASNVFVRLAMYWQLHLAYDTGYNYKTYDSYGEQFDNLFFARVDSYARTPSQAPKGGVKLNGNTDNNLMRLACAAAEKDLLEFFERWGMEPDEETRRYAGQFEKETRAIWLASDDQRVDALEKGAQPGETSGIQVSGSVSYDEKAGTGNQVEISLESQGDTDLYGYEIFRCEYQGGTVVRQPVTFVPAGESSYTDRIATVNNRAFAYEAVAYDIWLRPSERAVLGTARVCHNGNLDSSLWTVSTNMETVGDSEDEGPSMDNPDTTEKRTIERVIDGQNETTYKGKTRSVKNVDGKETAVEEPEIILYLNQPEVLTGLEYRLATGAGTPIGSFEIYVSRDGSSWERAATEETAFALQESGGVQSQRILFTAPAADGGRELRTYDASMVKLVAPGQAGKELAISELTLLGQTGDKVDLNSEGIGYLETDYKNPTDGQVLIPAGSLVFTGTYAGNPAYNSVLLWDEDGSLVGGFSGDDLVAEQLIFAPDPKEGDLRNISDGIWVYYIRKEHLNGVILPKRVRAELYRVDNALDQSGQRLVSSTVFAELPDSLPKIQLKGAQAGTIHAVNSVEVQRGGEAE